MSTFIMSVQPEAHGMRIKNLSKGLGRPKHSTCLSRDATMRLSWVDWHRAHGENVSLTCRHFHISRSTLYRWLGRYNRHNLTTLEGRSRRPQLVRRPTWTPDQLRAVLAIREAYPRWGKAKLALLLQAQGVEISESMVGRILTRARARGLLPEGRQPWLYAKKRRVDRPYAVRKPREYCPAEPGDLVQIDTLDVAYASGKHFKHFTMVDVVSRYSLLEIRGSATALMAKQSLDAMLTRCPFPVKAIQVDGGSEFMAEFEGACQQRGVRLFQLPPRSPKLNGHVERSQRTHTEEFYQCCSALPSVADIAPELARWERTYNHIRPHQALDYQTPAAFLRNRTSSRSSTGANQ